jgi:hypothetical protein
VRFVPSQTAAGSSAHTIVNAFQTVNTAKNATAAPSSGRSRSTPPRVNSATAARTVTKSVPGSHVVAANPPSSQAQPRKSASRSAAIAAPAFDSDGSSRPSALVIRLADATALTRGFPTRSAAVACLDDAHEPGRTS